MSKNPIPTRIQSRLTRKGIKVTLGEIKDVLCQIAVDADNPIDAEVDAVTEYFVNQASKPTLYHEDEIQAISPTGTEAYQSKSEIIESTAQSLGIILDTAEIAEIASNVNNSSDDLHDSLEEIKSAIVAFIKYKASVNSEKISQIVNDISQIAAEEFHQNSQELTDGLQSINQQLQQQSTDFKSKFKSALTAFAIPTIKAG